MPRPRTRTLARSSSRTASSRVRPRLRAWSCSRTTRRPCRSPGTPTSRCSASAPTGPSRAAPARALSTTGTRSTCAPAWRTRATTITTSPAYWNAMQSAFDTKYPPGAGGGILGGNKDFASVEQLLTASSVQPTAPTDTAVYVLSRQSGEGADRSAGAGDYQLSTTELADLAAIGHAYKHVVVVLNTGGIVDTSFYNTINAERDRPGRRTAAGLDAADEPGRPGVRQRGGRRARRRRHALGQAHRHLGLEVRLLPGVGDVRQQRREHRDGVLQRGHLRRLPLLRLVLQDDQPGRAGQRRQLPVRVRPVLHGLPDRHPAASRRTLHHVTVKVRVTNVGDQVQRQGRRRGLLLGADRRPGQAVPAAGRLREDRRPWPRVPRRWSRSRTTRRTWRPTTTPRPRTS